MWHLHKKAWVIEIRLVIGIREIQTKKIFLEMSKYKWTNYKIIPGQMVNETEEICFHV